jgi:hypothetical protein
MKQISILACLILVAACGADEARTPEPGVEEVIAPQTAQKDSVGEDMLLGDEGDYVDYVVPEPLSDVCSAALDDAFANMSVMTFNEFDMPLINGERANEEGYWRMWCENFAIIDDYSERSGCDFSGHVNWQIDDTAWPWATMEDYAENWERCPEILGQ